MKRLVIAKSWYYSVGKRYDWKADGFSEVGVGIAKPWLKENVAILVNVDKQDYRLDCIKALEFINKYKCFEDLSGVRIGYVCKDLLQKVGEETKKEDQPKLL